jgi:putative transposase
MSADGHRTPQSGARPGSVRANARFRKDAGVGGCASVHADVHNHFNSERHLVDRSTFKQRRSAALAEWQLLFS